MATSAQTVVESTGKQAAQASDPREQAIALHRQGRLAAALAAYQRHLENHPADAGIWANFGALHRQQKRHALAIACGRRALHLRPDDPGILSNLGNALKDADRFDEALECHRRALAARPGDAGFRFNHAVALREAEQYGQAIAELDRLLQHQPDNPHYRWDKALNLLQQGRYREAWPWYEARWHTGELPARREAAPRWQGEAFKGKRLLIFAEQGFGDTLMAARFLPWVKERGGHVTLECKPELHRLFRGLADELVTPTEQAMRTAANPAAFDAIVPMMSLMGVFAITPDTVPPPLPLSAPPEAKQAFASLQTQAPGCRKTGIVWSGSLSFKGNDKRALPLSAFLPLAQNPQTRLYSLQKGPPAAELAASLAGPLIVDLAPRLHDFADTAAAIEHLDDIRMTDSAVFHLAGCLGKPATCLVRRQVYWPYGALERWYPKAGLEYVAADGGES